MPTIKLGQALLNRADLQRTLSQLRERIVASAKVQEGDKPHEDPDKLLREALGIVDQINELVVAINRVNVKAKLPSGKTLMEAIAERDSLKQQQAVILGAVAGASAEASRYGTREIKWVAQFDIAKLHKQAEGVAKKLRELNSNIQEANWNIDVDV